MNQRPPGYEDYLDAIQALPIPSKHLLCAFMQPAFVKYFSSRSAPLVHYAYKHVVAILLRIYVAVRGCGQRRDITATKVRITATKVRHYCDKGATKALIRE